MWNLRFIFLIFNLDLELKLSSECAIRVILVNNIWGHMIGAMDSRNFFLASQRRSNLRPESRIVASFAQDVGTFYSKPHRFVHANLGCFGSISEAWFHSMNSAYFVGWTSKSLFDDGY